MLKVARMLHANKGTSSKKEQEQNSPNLEHRLMPISVEYIDLFSFQIIESTIACKFVCTCLYAYKTHSSKSKLVRTQNKSTFRTIIDHQKLTARTTR